MYVCTKCMVACLNISIIECMYVYVCVYVCVYDYVCMYVCMHVCRYVSTCMSTNWKRVSHGKALYGKSGNTLFYRHY